VNKELERRVSSPRAKSYRTALILKREVPCPFYLHARQRCYITGILVPVFYGIQYFTEYNIVQNINSITIQYSQKYFSGIQYRQQVILPTTRFGYGDVIIQSRTSRHIPNSENVPSQSPTSKSSSLSPQN
jgi:hypothetical protein